MQAMQLKIQSMVLLCSLAFPLAAQAELAASYRFNLSGNMAGNPFTSSFSLDNDFQLSGINMSVTGGMFNADFGDVSANWDNLGFAQRSFRGMSLNVPTGKVETTLVGGGIVTHDEKGRQVSSSIYGVRAALPLGERWRLSAAQLFTPDATDGSKNITSLGVNYLASARTKLGLEYVRSGAGSGWQMTTAREGKRLSMQGSYRRTESGFSSAGNPSVDAGRSGGFLGLRYKIARPLTASFNLHRYSNTNGGYSRFSSVQLRYFKPKRPSLTVFWRSSEQLRPQQMNGDRMRPSSDSARQSAGLHLSHAFRATRVAFQYDRLNFLSASDTDSNSMTQRFGFNLTRPLTRTTSLSFQHVLALRSKEQGGKERLGHTRMVFNRRLGRRGMRADLGFEHQYYNEDKTSSQSLGLLLGLNLPLGGSSSLGLQYQPNLFTSGTSSKSASDKLYLSFTHRMGGKSGLTQALQSRKRMGQISGRVFEDLNGNGKPDQGEPGISRIGLALGAGQKQQTDDGGRFNIQEIHAGNYRFQLMIKTLPIEFTTLTSTDVPLQVAEGQKVTVDFPVARTGRVEGVVFLDDNRNGTQDQDEKGIANAIVRVESSEIISFTDAKGNFTLYGLAPRSWKILLDVAALGQDMESTGVGFAEVDVPSNGLVTGTRLGVATRERNIVSTFEKNSL